MTIKRQNINGKKLLMTITASAVLLGSIFAISFGDEMTAFAMKPEKSVGWTDGFPTGEHSTMNIHGKKADFNCDNSQEGIELYGNSVFVLLEGTSQIDIVSNKRSDLTQGKAIDPCADPFGIEGVNDDDPALYQLPTGEQQVYWRILGKPNNGNGQNGNDGSSEARITSPTLKDQCNFLPTAFADGSTVQWFDPDAQANLGAGLDLIAFNVDEMYVESGDFAGFDNLDSIYRDSVTSPGVVDATDTVLYGGANLDDPLLSFDPNVKHEDSINNSEFDMGETIYFSTDDFVNQDDIRLANAFSQGLDESEGGDAVDCTDETLVGLGLINSQGVFGLDEEAGLERFHDDDAKGKGKSKAINITELFEWTGAICDAAILDTWDSDSDLSITITDFDPDHSGDITAIELDAIVGADLVMLSQDLIDAAEDAVLANPDHDADDLIDNGVIDTDAEFAYFLEIQFGEQFNCEAFIDEWVFNIADIVLYGFDYENNGTTLSQMRFYPTATSEFVE